MRVPPEHSCVPFRHTPPGIRDTDGIDVRAGEWEPKLRLRVVEKGEYSVCNNKRMNNWLDSRHSVHME